MKWNWKCFLLYFLEEFVSDWCKFFKKYLIGFSWENTWAWNFLCERFLMMNSVIKTHIGLFRFIFYLMSILIHYSKKVSISLHFFFNDPATTEIYTLSLHDALPISPRAHALQQENPLQWEARAPQRRVAPARCN